MESKDLVKQGCFPHNHDYHNHGHDCEHRPFPMVSLEDVVAADGTPLNQMLDRVNHIFLPFTNNTRKDTRLQVPVSMRRKGLWITYVSCKGNVTTEYYIGEYTDIDSWINPNNWVSYLDNTIIEKTVNDMLSWYKA